jgi:argininosuccinate lyase
MRLWGGRFSGQSDPAVAEFTRSLDVDRVLAIDDIVGSIAHVRGLGRAGLLRQDEVDVIVGGLQALREEVEAGTFPWDPALEDVHLNIEAALTARIGAVAGKLHTGRSRNDQVALDLRLWLRRTVSAVDAAAADLERALVALAEREGEAVMPGMTHGQPAQPVLLAHHLLAYVEMLERDRGRFSDGLRRADRCPLGAGALAGAGFLLDREATAADLGFSGVTANSLDAVSDRDFAVEFLAAAALCMVHLSRLAEELVWWSSPAFGWVELADAHDTGSSMMPNKKNPDPCELVRGRTARVQGHLSAMLGVLKGLPLAYQRDLQEDKTALFDTAAVLESSLRVMAVVIDGLTVRPERMRRAALAGQVTATSVADALVERGLPFRVAHHVVGRLVAEAEGAGVRLDELPDSSFTAALAAEDNADAQRLAGEARRSGSMAMALRDAATLEAALGRPRVTGGTAPERVREALAAARQRLDRDRRARWDKRHAKAVHVETSGPNPQLMAACADLRPGRALDLGTGDGTNAVWLARHGWEVTAVDFSPVGLDKGRAQAAAEGVAVTWVMADLREYEPPSGAFDLVTLLFLHLPPDERRPIYARAAAAVAPGGTLLVVGHDRSNLEHGVGGPRDPAVLFTPEEIVAELPGFDIVQGEVVARPTPSGRAALDAVVRAVRTVRGANASST